MSNTIATTEKKSIAQKAKEYALSNGYNCTAFTDKALNKATGNYFMNKARGDLSLWDAARALYEIKSDIQGDKYTEVSSFKAYCITAGIDFSNAAKYVRAYDEYSMLKDYGFSLAVAVKLIGSGIDAAEFCDTYKASEMTTKTAAEIAKRAKNVIEVSCDEESPAPEEAPAPEEVPAPEEKTENETPAGIGYDMNYNTLCAIIQYARENTETSPDDIIAMFRRNI